MVAMSGARLRLLLALGLTGTATLAVAQAKKPAKFAVPGSSDSVSTASKDGRPASRGRRSSPRADAAVATFPGFRLLPDGRSRIYVELTKAVSVDEQRAEGKLVYVIHDARVPVRNNRNSLITTHFATPVGRARLLTAGGDVELIIDLRQAASASQKIVAGDNGGVRLEVDFPAGNYPPTPGLYDPPAAKGRSRDDDGAEDGEAGSAPSAAPSPRPSDTAPAAPPAPPAPPPGDTKAPAAPRNP
jgi:hypothetical protein